MCVCVCVCVFVFVQGQASAPVWANQPHQQIKFCY